jgi:hypothetical protein
MGYGRNGHAWTPAPIRMPALSQNQPALGQGGFLENPTLALALDAWTALTAGYLGWGLSQRHNNWGTFWYVVAGVSVVKALHDMGRVGK